MEKKLKAAIREKYAELCRWRRPTYNGEHYICQLKERKGKNFGNGREARRLFQTAKEELALRALTDSTAESELSEEDLRHAADRLLAQEKEHTSAMNAIGFCR